MIHLPKSKDFWAGMLFTAFALLAYYFGSSLTLGTARQMGPRYFPATVATVLLVLGLITMAKGLKDEADAVEPGKLRPFLVIVSVFAFTLLLRPAGLVLAVIASVLIAGFATRPATPIVRSSGIAVVLAAFASVLFILVLRLPLTAWPS